MLLGIDDPGPALGPEADATPNDGALPTDGPTAPDALTDARVDIDDGGLDGGGPCRPLVAESFTGDSGPSYSTDTDQVGGLEVLINNGVRVTVGTVTGQAHFAYIKFPNLHAGDWNTAILKVDLTLGEPGASDAAVTDTLISLTAGAKDLGLERITTLKSTFHFLGKPSAVVSIPFMERVTLTYTFASPTGDASVAKIMVTKMGDASDEFPDPDRRHLAVAGDSGIELKIGAFGVAASPALSYIIHKVSLCVQ